MAFVILHAHATESWEGREGAFEKALKEYSRSKLPGFARPEWVRVVDVLPKTSTGASGGAEKRSLATLMGARQDPENGVTEDRCKAMKEARPA
jgi:hypothetical protein